MNPLIGNSFCIVVVFSRFLKSKSKEVSQIREEQEKGRVGSGPSSPGGAEECEGFAKGPIGHRA